MWRAPDDSRRPTGPADEPWSNLLAAAIRAAVLVPENDLRNWFSWPVPDGVVDNLVAEGQIARPAPGWLSLVDDRPGPILSAQ